MSPIEAIEGLDELRTGLNRLVVHLQWEFEERKERWEGLGCAGGQRDDHAAALLGALRQHLRGISEYCRTAEGQIDAMVADPFQRETADAK